MLFLKFLFVAVTSFPAFWCSLSIGKVESDTFLFEDGNLSAVFSGKCSGKCLFQQSTNSSPSKFYLQGFMFDERNVKLFSNAICEVQLQELTIDGCYINDELAGLFSFPSNLKSIRLERLNLTSRGIQSILDKLPPSLESLEMVDCLNSEPIQKKSLDLSNFSHLKTISIDNSRDGINSYNLLISLSLLQLEKIKLSCVYLGTEKFKNLLSKWKEPKGVVFFNSLKEFDFNFVFISGDILAELVQFLFSLPSLEIISLKAINCCKDVSLPPLPSNIKQLSLPFKTVSMEDGKTPFYNSKNLSHLTHLTVKDSFKVFPYDLFDLSQLEYLEIWSPISANHSLLKDRHCSKLKYLSIQSGYLIPLLFNFENNFPVIETLVINSVSPQIFDPHLKKIIACKTLKYLTIDYTNSVQSSLKIDKEIKSSIEELTLTRVCWEIVFNLLDVEQFPLLKKIHIETKTTNLDLERVFGKLCLFPKLSSLTLIGNFLVSSKKMTFTFENLKFFRFEFNKETLVLDCLLSCMPNLIELRLDRGYLKEIKLENQVDIRYSVLPSNFPIDKRNFVNFLKNTPNLIQFKECFFSRIQNIPFVPDLAYYFKELKRYFNNELQFEINPDCFPIKQFKYDNNLLKLVRFKSPELQNYLKSVFPIDTFKPVLKQLFTIEIEGEFNVELVKPFFDFLDEFKVSSEEDISLAKKVLLEGRNESFTESTNFPLNDFCKIFSNHLTQYAEINFESVHLKFIREFFKVNKKYGPLKIYKFLKSFFIYLSDGQSMITSKEIFDFFSPHFLTSFRPLFDKIKEGETSSFVSLFNQIKKNKLSEEEEKSLISNLKATAENLKKLKPKKYDKLSAHFKAILMKVSCDSLVESFLDILKVASIPNSQCPICMESLFSKECKFFKSSNDNCHLFHRHCLNRWLEKNKTCPQCRGHV